MPLRASPPRPTVTTSLAPLATPSTPLHAPLATPSTAPLASLSTRAEPPLIAATIACRTKSVVMPVPPPLSALYANVPGRGRVLSKRYKRWREITYPILSMQLEDWQAVAMPCSLEIDVERLPQRCDLSNRVKATEDALCKTNYLVDDHLVHNLRIRWVSSVESEYEPHELNWNKQLARITLTAPSR